MKTDRKLKNENIPQGIIRAVAFFLCSTVVLYSHAQDSILNQELTLSIKDKTLYEAFTIITKETGYHFSYSADIVPAQENVSIDAASLPLKKILSNLIGNPLLEFKIIDKQIVIYKPRGDIENTIDSLKILPNYLEIMGKIIDVDSKEPLPFANIYIAGRNTGTVSNTDGDFVFKVVNPQAGDSLEISYIGYKNYKTSLFDLKKKENVVALTEDFIPIQEVIVRHIDPIKLLQSAINKIPQNYSVSPNMLTSFYRESVKKNNKYVAISEAILEIYKASYKDSFDSDQVRVYKSRKNTDISNVDTILLKIKAGLNTTLLLDVVKNPSEFLKEDYFQFYNYRLSDIVLYDDRLTHVVDFYQKEEVPTPLYQGKIYIDVNDLAIKLVEFELTPKGVKQIGADLVVKKPGSVNVKPLSANYLASYRKINGTYYLNHVMCNLKFKIRKKKDIFNTVFDTNVAMAVNEIDTVNVKKFKWKEATKPTNIFTDQIIDYDESFWGEHNYIRPDEPLQEAFIRIREQMARNKSTEEISQKKSENIVQQIE